jgi:PEP-CTERM motif
MKSLGLLLVTALIVVPLKAHAGPFTQGDLVVYRIGTGSGALTSAATAVFVDEYTTSGTLAQSIPMPTTANGAQLALTASGTATSEGYLNLSGNGQYLTLTGYDSPAGTTGVAGSAAATTPRVVGRVSANGNLDTSTSFTTAFDKNNIRSAYSSDGSTIWASGAGTAGDGGIWSTTWGATNGTQLNAVVTNTRVLEGFSGQLYVSSNAASNAGVNSVGAGLPTSPGQNLSLIVGSTSVFDYFFADLDPSVPGLDTLYLADDGGGSSPGGIKKYSLVGGNWILNNIVGAGADNYRGLTGEVTANGVQLFATRQSTTNPGIVALTDSAGYNANDNGTPNLIVPLPNNEAFRGIDFAPHAAVPEPDTLVLLCLGALGLGVWTRTKRTC